MARGTTGSSSRGGGNGGNLETRVVSLPCRGGIGFPDLLQKSLCINDQAEEAIALVCKDLLLQNQVGVRRATLVCGGGGGSVRERGEDVVCGGGGGLVSIGLVEAEARQRVPPLRGSVLSREV